jgi:two-component system, NarL family, nitrate/nitrite response regulator NarL
VEWALFLSERFIHFLDRGRVRILVADDQPGIRKRVCLTLAARLTLEICDEAANGQEAVEKAQESNPDLIILDITMPLLNGFDAARQIRVFSPDTPILILTMHKSRQLMEEAQKIGVHGYVVKAEAGQSLVNAVTALLQHQTFFPTEF